MQINIKSLGLGTVGCGTLNLEAFQQLDAVTEISCVLRVEGQ